MSASKLAISAAALAAASFGVGFLSGTRGERGGLDLDRARSRVREAVAAPDALEQTARILPALEAMNPEDAATLAQAFEAGFASGGGGLPLELFVESWARFDPEACRTRVESWPPDIQRQAWPALMRAWARLDPHAALERLAQLPDASMHWPAQTALIEGWSGSDQPGLWSTLAQLPDHERRRELAARAVADRLRLRGVDPLLRELDAMPEVAPDDPFRGELMIAAADAIARQDIPRAVAFVEAQRERSWHPETLRVLALEWASSDAPGALDWLRAQPVGTPRDSAMRYAYRRWFRNDPPRAESWIAERIAEADFAPVVLAHAAALALEEPARASTWLQRIPDSTLRERAQREIDEMAKWRQRARPAPPQAQRGGAAPESPARGTDDRS